MIAGALAVEMMVSILQHSEGWVDTVGLNKLYRPIIIIIIIIIITRRMSGTVMATHS